MAQYVRKYGQGAVQGSLAYDFNHPALNPEYTEEAKWQVQHQVKNPVVEEEQTAAKAVARNAQALSPLSVLGLAIAAVLFVVMLLAQVRLTAVSDEAVRLTNKISQLETEQTRLLIAFESAFNLTEIEEYAVNELGMQKPHSDQIFYIDSAAHDKVEVISAENADSVLDRVSDFVGSIGEYLG